MTARKAIAIDANLLVLLIVGLTDVRYIGRHKRTARVYDVEGFRFVQGLVEKAREVVITAHILTEASNHLRQCSEPMRSEIMLTFRAFIARANEAVVFGKAAAASPSFVRLGLTDAVIASLDPADIQLLTVDHDLHVACARSGLEVLNLSSHLFG